MLVEFEAKINDEDVKIGFDSPGNFVATDLMSAIIDVKTGDAKLGTFVKKCIAADVIAYPKKMLDMLTQSDDPSDVTMMSNALQSFLTSPKKFKETIERQLEKEKVESQEPSNNNDAITESKK